MGLLIDEEKPIIWRGPMVQGALTQLIDEVMWENLDYLVNDLTSRNRRCILSYFTKT